MSEFSCNYHLKTENIEDCINLIKRANVTGFVFPPRDGWTSFVVNEPDFIFSKKLIDANDGILIQLISVEDYGWSFEIYDKDIKLCMFACMYDTDEVFSHQKNVENWDGLFNQNQSDVLDKVFAMNKNTSPEDCIYATDFADGMGLYFYEWISYSYICEYSPISYREYNELELLRVSASD